ncbi:hypothetical protein NE237_001706 [Protea cynaroides]|uniref:Uncharacterized protein n=1 Tax=Protea cynaroides TaxID=273540 RepID=A0A9Q0QYC9_9MAGN|nr:hypothetical protein NE237_001706 [Protea cynaroides]
MLDGCIDLLQIDTKLPMDIFENVMQLAIEGFKAVANYIREDIPSNLQEKIECGIFFVQKAAYQVEVVVLHLLNMGAVKLELQCSENINGVAVYRQPDWNLDSLEVQLDASSLCHVPFTKSRIWYSFVRKRLFYSLFCCSSARLISRTRCNNILSGKQ